MLARRTPLHASTPLRAMSDKKRAKLAADGVTPFSTLTPAKPVMRAAAPVKRKKPAATGPGDAIVSAVLERDRRCCVRCGLAVSGARGVDWSVHHRKLRSQGVDNSLPNLIVLHGSGTTGCHGYVHANPAEARREGGWILRSTDDPAAYPVKYVRFGLVLLTADGGVEPVGQVAA